ncbi:MAG TPA: ribosome biogenesis GTPase Der [Desulfuromonadales bacterium]|nr:ribosome biogenesis GTPase Der [Desulfuromonadales bacterium]
MKPIVAIVGRPNVGKSTFFNRLLGHRRAMVADTPGVTRDRNYATITRFEKPFILIDTGGFEPVTEDRLLQQMREQSRLAIEEADVIIFMMDARSGLTPADTEVAGMLRRVGKPVFYVVNKVDGDKLENESAEFYSLGIDTLHTISAEHNRGVNDLVGELLEVLPDAAVENDDSDITRIAVVGRPNVGKSSLVNRLLGFERVVANPTAGTTRDSVDTPFICNRKRYILIDTAGIRRKGKTTEKLEKYSVVDALRSIERADVVLMVIDAVEGVTEQDERIAGYIHEAGKGCVFIINKWDALAKDNATLGIYIDKVRTGFKYLAYAPIVCVSAQTGQRTGKIVATVDAVMEQFCRRVSTSDLVRVFQEAVEAHHAPLSHGKRVKFYFATQVATRPPAFVVFTNQPDNIHFSYERYLINKFREAFGFDGVPLRIMFRGREKNGTSRRAAPASSAQ